MEYTRYFTPIGAGLVALVFLPLLVMFVLRSRKIPECFSCGARKVRLSRPEGFWDTFFIAFFLDPYRCEGCRARFYAFRRSAESKKPTPQRLVKVAFRFQNGLPNRIAIRVKDHRSPAVLPS
jgi:hypothetical protein